LADIINNYNAKQKSVKRVTVYGTTVQGAENQHCQSLDVSLHFFSSGAPVLT